MKKIFTLLAAAAVTLSAMADTMILSNPGKVKQNILAGADLGTDVPDGWQMQCMNEAKNLEAGTASFDINGNQYIPIKFSNGAQNTVTLPDGLVATKVTFYTTINKDAATQRPCYWAEVGGVEYTLEDNHGIIESFKDYGNPNIQSFDLNNLNQFTFKNAGEQPFAVLEVEYTKGDTSAITDIAADENAPVEYFNLQGMRVENPANGLFIKRQGSKVSKVIIK